MTARLCRILASFLLLSLSACSNDTTGPGGNPSPPAFQLLWGTERAGTFERFPISAAVTNDGSFYVLESWLGSTIHQFDVTGAFVRRWDAGHENSRRIRFDAAGNRLLVTGPAFVRVYSRTGEVIQEWGVAGTGESEFERIDDLAVDDDANIYVLDGGKRAVLKFSPQGEFIRSWGGRGLDPGLFENPSCLTFVQGLILVVDPERGDVQRFTKDGTPAGSWSLEVVRDRPAQALNFEDIVPDGTGNVVVLDPFSTIMSRVTSDGTLLEQHNACRETNECVPGLGFTLGPDGDVFILRYDGIRRLDGAGEIMNRIGRSYGDDPSSIVRPRDLAVDRAGNVFVLDGEGHIRKFSPEGTFIQALRITGMNLPLDCITMDESDRLLAALSSTLFVFSADGSVERTERLEAASSGFKPQDMAVDPDGFLYVFDIAHDVPGRISKFTPDGALAQTWTFGSRPENELVGGEAEIVVDDRGHVWVCQPRLGLYEFTADGSTVRRFEARRGSPAIESPTGIAFDSDGSLYVSDMNSSRVSAYSFSGGLRFVVGGVGSAAGEFSLPSALAIDNQGHLFVADSGNDRVQRFGY